MKKIILAVASLLTLGMLVSCKQEISGNLTVTDIQYNAFQATTETYYYKVTGSEKIVTYVTQTTKTSIAAFGIGAYSQTATTDLNVNSANPVVTVVVNKDPTSNVTTYTINVPALEGKTTTVTKVGTATETTEYSVANRAATSKTITKIGSTFYYTNDAGEKVVIKDFDPTAATLDLSKLSEKDKTTTTTGTRQYTTDGTEWWSSKTETTTIPTYSLTYTKL